MLHVLFSYWSLGKRNVVSFLACVVLFSREGLADGNSPGLFDGDVGAHHRVWTNDATNGHFRKGDKSPRTVEIATGLNYWDGAQWVPSEASFKTNGNGFRAEKLGHKVHIKPNLNRVGSISVTLPDGTELKSCPVGVGLYDAASGQSTIIGVLKDCSGEVVAPNEVIFRDAFTGICADVLVTVDRGSFQQDVILTARIDPVTWGFPTNTTRIQIFTEFYDGHQPDRLLHPLYVEADEAKRAQRVSPDLVDEVLQFGDFVIGTGKAFAAAPTADSAPFEAVVAKEFKTVSNRTFLVESVEYVAIKAGLDALPDCGEQGSIPGRKVRSGEVVGVVPPVPGANISASVEVAPTASIAQNVKMLQKGAARGVVIDYNATVSSSSVPSLFKGDTTYFISGAVSCNSPTTIEGGAVFKYPNSTGTTSTTASIQINSTLTCKTTQFRPAIFTAGDDSTVGETLNSTIWSNFGQGTVATQYYANPAIIIPYPYDTTTLSNLRFRYAQEAIKITGPSGYVNVNVNHSQFLNCLKGIELQGTGCGSGSTVGCGVVVNVNNCLMAGVSTAYLATISGSTYYANLKNCTVDQSTQFANGITGTSSPYNVYCVNCVLSRAGANTGNVVLSGANNGFYTSGSGQITAFGTATQISTTLPFQTAGAGNYYLAKNSAFRNAGQTAGISTSLQSDIKLRTTYPPILLTTGGTLGKLLDPAVARDTDVPDLGYHYDPLDYLGAQMVAPKSGGSVILTNGVSLGLYGSFGISIPEGGSVISEGQALAMNRIVWYPGVQEQATVSGLATALGAGVFDVSGASSTSTTAVKPVLQLRFTDIPILGHLQPFFNGAATPMNLGTIGIKDSWMRGVSLNVSANAVDYQPATIPSIGLTNNLIERGTIALYNGYAASVNSLLSVSIFNNLFWQANNALVLTYNVGTGSNPLWTIRDNLFDGDTVALTGIGMFGTYVTPSYNAFFNTVSTPLAGTGNVSLTALTYASGAVSTLSWYVNASTPTLKDADTARTADLAGLYHYTMYTSQVKELNSYVDIGFHYVSLSGTTPQDSDGDGIPDYLEDRNGNNVVDSGETSWLNSDSDFDGVSDGAELAAGKNPLDANSTVQTRLAIWKFDDSGLTPPFNGDGNQHPQSYVGLTAPGSWTNTAVQFGLNGGDVTTHQLTYHVHETSPYLVNVGPQSGSVRFWFRPNWTSRVLGVMGNSQLTSEARLFTVATKQTATPYAGYWSMGVVPSGSSTQADNLQFDAQYPNSSTTTNISVPIAWQWNEWHQVVLAWGLGLNNTNSVSLYLDGELAAQAVNQTAPFSSTATFNGNFSLGCALDGTLPGRGRFELLETFNYPLTAAKVRSDYNLALAVDTDKDGLPDIREDTFGTKFIVPAAPGAPNDSDTDKDGMPDFYETAYARFNPDGTYASSGLNPLVADGTGDLDSDQVNNYTEYVNLTNPVLPPRSPRPVPTYDAASFPQDLVNIDFTPIPGKTPPVGTAAAGYSSADRWNIFTGVAKGTSSGTSEAIPALSTGVSLINAAGDPSNARINVGWGPIEWWESDWSTIWPGWFSWRSSCSRYGISDAGGTGSYAWCWSNWLHTYWYNRFMDRLTCTGWDTANTDWWVPYILDGPPDGSLLDWGNLNPLAYPYYTSWYGVGGYGYGWWDYYYGVPMMVYALDAGPVSNGAGWVPPGLPSSWGDYLYSTADDKLEVGWGKGFDCNSWFSSWGAQEWFEPLAKNTVIAVSGLADADYKIYIATQVANPPWDGANATGTTRSPVFAFTGTPSSPFVPGWQGMEGGQMNLANKVDGPWSMFLVHPENGIVRLVMPYVAGVNAMQIMRIGPPTPPANLVATAGYGAIRLDWDPVPNSTRYRVSRSTSASGPFTEIGFDIAGVYPAYIDNGLKDGVTYYYYVSAENNEGSGLASAIVGATTLIPSSGVVNGPNVPPSGPGGNNGPNPGVNTPPTISHVKTLEGATRDTPFTISFINLLSASNAKDAESNPLSFWIDSNVANGVLTVTHQGATSPASLPTLFGPMDTMVWTPPAGQTAVSMPAFNVKAFDGLVLSEQEAQVSIHLAAPSTLVGWGSEANGQMGDGILKLTWRVEEEHRNAASALSSEPEYVLTPGVGALVPIVNTANVAGTEAGDQSWLMMAGKDGSLTGWGTAFDGYPMGLRSPVQTFHDLYRGTYRSAIEVANTIQYTNAPSTAFAPFNGVVKTVSTYNSVLALRTDGTVWMWGGYDSPKQEDWVTDPPAIPAYAVDPSGGVLAIPAFPNQVPTLANIVDIAGSGSSVLAVDSRGSLWWWGQIQVSGADHFDGTYSWTDVYYHTLPGDNGSYNLPNRIPVVGKEGKNVYFKQVVAANDYFLALADDGTVWEFGLIYRNDIVANGPGYTLGGASWGNATGLYNPTPAQVPGLSRVTAIDTSGYYSMALLSDGSVRAWGFLMGSDGTMMWISRYPRLLPGLARVKQISTGGYVNLAVDTEGHLWGWGQNANLQLMDDNPNADSATPRRLGDLENVGYAYAGSATSFASAELPQNQPLGLIASGLNHQVKLKWKPYPGAYRYNVKRSTSSNGPFVAIGTCQDPSFIDNGVDNGTAYYYVVSADLTQSTSGTKTNDSDPALATAQPPPAAIASGIATTASCHQVLLNWNAVSGASTYRLYRTASTAGSAPVLVASVPNGPNPVVYYADQNVPDVVNGSYTYYIIASNASGDGPPSPPSIPVLSANLDACSPPPLGLTSVTTQQTSADGTTYFLNLTLSWSSPTGIVVPSDYSDASISGYNVKEFDKNINGFRVIEPSLGALTSYSLETAAGMTRTFVVSAVISATASDGTSAKFESADSAPYTVTSHCVTCAPGSVAPLTASGGDKVVMLTWHLDDKADQYIVEYKKTSDTIWMNISVPNASEVNSDGFDGTRYFWHRPASTGADPVNGTPYDYRVTATNTASQTAGNPSIVHVTPGRPQMQTQQAVLCTDPNYGLSGVLCLTATPYSGKVELRWPNSSGVPYPNDWQFFVQRRNAAIQTPSTPASAWQVVSGMGYGLSYLDADVVNGTLYEYRVVAFDAMGNRLDSVVASATPISAAGFVLQALGGNRFVQLTWPSSPSDTGGDINFIVWKATSPTGPWTRMGQYFPGDTTITLPTDSSNFGYTDDGVVNGTSYYYQVSVVAGAGELYRSPVAVALPSAAGAPKPPSFTATLGPADGQAMVEIDFVPGTTSTQWEVACSDPSAPPADNSSSWTAYTPASGTHAGLAFTPCTAAGSGLWIRGRSVNGSANSSWVYQMLDYASWKASGGSTVENKGKILAFVGLPSQVFTPTNLVIRVSTDAADVDRVDFFGNGNYLGTARTAPYEVTWFGIPAGIASITAEATSKGDGSVVSGQASVTVTWTPQLADYTTSASDLELPAPGRPISLSRGYSANYAAPSSALGQGWTASWLSPGLTVDTDLSSNWQMGTPGGILPGYPITDTQTLHTVTVTMPDGSAAQFRAYIDTTIDSENPLTPGAVFPLNFVPEDASGGTLSCSTAIGLAVRKDTGGDTEGDTDWGDGAPLSLRLDSDDTQRFDPTIGGQFTYTGPDGSQSVFVWNFAAQKWSILTTTDLNGNYLAYTYDANNSGILTNISAYPKGGGTPIRTVSFAYSSVSSPSENIILAYDSIESAKAANDPTLSPTLRYVVSTPAGGPATLVAVDRMVSRKVGTQAATYTVTQYSYVTQSPNHPQLAFVRQLPQVVTISNPNLTDTSDTQASLAMLHNVYDANGKLSSQTDARGRTTSWTINTQQMTVQLNQTIGGVAVQSTVTHTLDGRPSMATDPNLNQTSFTYDDQGRLSSKQGPAPVNATTTMSYDSFGRQNATTDASGATSSTELDAYGNPLSVVDNRGNTTTMVYDANGNLQSTTDAVQKQTTYTYDTTFVNLPATVTESGPGIPFPIVSASSYTTKGELMSQKLYLTSDQSQMVQTDYQYDGNGNQTQQIQYRVKTFGGSRQALTTLMAVDALGRATNTTDALSRLTQSVYDAFGRVIQTIDPLIRTTLMYYDAVGNLVQTIYPDGTLTRTVYDEANHPIFSLDRMAPDAATLLAAQSPSSSSTTVTSSGTLSTYDNSGRVIATKRYASASVTLAADSGATSGMSQVATTLGGTFGTLVAQTRTDYDPMGRVVYRVDPVGSVTGYSYDAMGRVLSETRYAVGNTGYLGTLTAIVPSTLTSTQQNGTTIQMPPSVTTYGYDANGNRVWMVDANHQSAAGTDPTSSAHAANRTDYLYDEANRLLGTVSPAVSSQNGQRLLRATQYDALGRKTMGTDENGINTAYSYDPAGRLTSVTQDYHTTIPTGTTPQTTYYEYDEVGNLVTVRDAMDGFTVSGGNVVAATQYNRATRYEYDDLGRRTKTTLPDTKTEVTSYQTIGMAGTTYSIQSNLVTGFNGKTTTLVFDILDRPFARVPDTSLTGEVPVTFGYNALGQRAWMEDASGHTTYGYDAIGRLQAKTTPFGTLNYTYNNDNSMGTLSSTSATGVSLSYGYNALHRLSTVQNMRLSSNISSYAFDLVGNLSTLSYPNGIQHAYSYREDYRLLSVNHNYASAVPASFVYTLDAAGHRTTVAETLPNLTSQNVSYTYDNLGTATGAPRLFRLVSENWATGNKLWTYAYDRVGNRLSATSPSHLTAYSQTYDVRDRQTADSRNTSIAPAWDDNGNQLRYSGNDVNGDGTADQSATTADAFNFENQLKTRTKADNTVVSMAYDGDGNRVFKSVGSTATTYLVDDRNPSGYAQVVEETVLPATPLNGLVGRWGMNEGSATTVSDLSGNRNHGSFVNTPTWITGGAVASALQFGSSQAQVSVADKSSLELTSALSLSFWMKMDSVPTAATRLIGKGTTANQNYGVWTAANDSHLYFQYVNTSGTAQTAVTAATFATGTWYHVAVTFDGTGAVNFYVNGTLNATRAVSGAAKSSSTDPLTLGCLPTGTSFAGKLDEVCLYNRVINSGEVTGLATATGTGVTSRYNVGLALIAQERLSAGVWAPSYYGADGHGNVRVLYGATGNQTDTYTYDAFGNLVTQTSTSGTATVNNFRFAGEQWDPDLNLYYNRARYLNPDTGRFTSSDTLEQGPGDLENLHKYLYVGNDPVDGIDPSGHESLGEIISVEGITSMMQRWSQSRPIRFITRGLRDKIADVYVVASKSLPGVPFHAFIYVNQTKSNFGLRYDVGLEPRDVRRFLKAGFSRYLTIFQFGQFSVSATSLPDVRLGSTKMFRIAKFNKGQEVAWGALVIPLGMVEGEDGEGTARIPYSFPGYPFTFNCFKWTAEAAGAAVVVQYAPF